MSVSTALLNTNFSQKKTPSPMTMTATAALKIFEITEEEKTIAWNQLEFLLNNQVFFNVNNYSIIFNWTKELCANLALKLRFAITGGGCHGFRYNPTLAQQIQPQDTVITYLLTTSVEVFCLIDPFSLQILRGAEIDYEENIQGGHFIIRNLKTKTTCGCGASFTL